jgi:[citrate (pro-3S)-lyase] ligase
MGRNGNLWFLADKKGRYWNTKNGFRVTTDTPENARNTIYMFGSSRIIGTGAEDKETISSYLQRRINIDGARAYSVVNCGNYFASLDERQIDLLRTLQFHDGDIVLSFVGTYDPYRYQALQDRLPVCDLQHLFQRPHDYGELFWNYTHWNFRGNKIIADKVFEFLQDNKLLDQSAENRDSATLVKEEEFSPPHNSLSAEESEELASFLDTLKSYKQRIGAIVMNCNPFTLGHRYLIEFAIQRVDRLFIFVVEEDTSFFPFQDRLQLVKQGTADLSNVTVLPSGKFIISQRTFAAYSNKEELQDQVIDPTMDVELFVKYIAPVLNIDVRFAGEEPLDNITRQYNATMQRLLPENGIEFVVIPRKEIKGAPISASRVRALLRQQKFEAIEKLVPQTTLDYLKATWQL